MPGTMRDGRTLASFVLPELRMPLRSLWPLPGDVAALESVRTRRGEHRGLFPKVTRGCLAESLCLGCFKGLPRSLSFSRRSCSHDLDRTDGQCPEDECRVRLCLELEGLRRFREARFPQCRGDESSARGARGCFPIRVE